MKRLMSVAALGALIGSVAFAEPIVTQTFTDFTTWSNAVTGTVSETFPLTYPTGGVTTVTGTMGSVLSAGTYVETLANPSGTSQTTTFTYAPGFAAFSGVFTLDLGDDDYGSGVIVSIAGNPTPILILDFTVEAPQTQFFFGYTFSESVTSITLSTALAANPLEKEKFSVSSLKFADPGVSEVPEPATMGLLGFGLLGMGLARRRFRRA